jgi:hypothetical protein
MKEGSVVVLDKEDEMLYSSNYSRQLIYQADLILCGDKVIKNRWGKHGTIGEPYLQQQVEHTLQTVLDIWNKMKKGKKIKEIK